MVSALSECCRQTPIWFDHVNWLCTGNALGFSPPFLNVSSPPNGEFATVGVDKRRTLTPADPSSKFLTPLLISASQQGHGRRWS